MDLLLSSVEADFPVERAIRVLTTFVDALSFGTAAIILRVSGVSSHLTLAKRDVALVANSVVDLDSRLG